MEQLEKYNCNQSKGQACVRLRVQWKLKNEVAKLLKKYVYLELIPTKSCSAREVNTVSIFKTVLRIVPGVTKQIVAH